jgi:hypothetical protein
MTEFVVELANRPGSLARLAEILAGAGINVEALSAWGANGDGVARLIVDDEAACRRALAEAGLRVHENLVLSASLPNRPGALAETARALADAQVNVEAMYVLRHAGDRVDVAIAVDDPEAAMPLLPITGTMTLG